MDRIKKIRDDIKSGWDNMEKSKRTQLIVFVSAIIIVLASLTYFTQRTEYKVLFSNLEEADSGAIVEDLTANGIDYRLENNGTTILIDEKQVDNYRIQLASDGLMPESSTGFEIFDSASMMATDDDRQIMYQRAISGELERAIASISEISSAKVLLSIPEESVFQNPEYQKEASASVILDLKTSNQPSQGTIQGIGSLVSGAVENLPIENIQIVDTKGNLLSQSLAGADGMLGADLVSSQHSIKRSIEKDLEDKVLSLIGPLFGMNRVNVSVNAEMNFDAVEREVTAYENLETSDDPAIRSQTEIVTGSEALAGQVQSGSLDDATGAIVGTDGGAGDNSTYEHTTNYELDQQIERIVEAPGTINNLTASVLIMDTQNNMDGIISLVENALGTDRQNIEVVFVPMVEDESGQLLPEIDLGGDISRALKEYWPYLLGGLFVFLLFLSISRRIRKSRREKELEEAESEQQYNESLAYQDAMNKLNTLADPNEAEIERQVANEKAAKNEKQVRDLAEENPALAAELVKLWVKEDENA